MPYFIADTHEMTKIPITFPRKKDAKKAFNEMGSPQCLEVISVDEYLSIKRYNEYS